MLQANVRLDNKVIARYKHSSLIGLVVSNEGKKFYNIDTWWLSCLALPQIKKNLRHSDDSLGNFSSAAVAIDGKPCAQIGL
jgi:hypothetical protein